MKLYIYEHCPFCTRARMIFGLKGIPVELAVVMEGDAATPTRLIGKKTVPILQKDDGSCMGESLDIVRYVDGLGTPLLTASPAPALETWCEDVWGLALKLFIPRFTQGAFAELATGEAREAYRLREQRAFGDLQALQAETPALLAAITPRLQALAELLQGRQGIGQSDIVLWPILRSLSIVDGIPFGAVVGDYAERLARRCGVPMLFDQAM